MNILLFVTTLVMVMGILTYSKLQTFISYSAVQSEFNSYMKNVERSSINEQADWIYDENPASKSTSSKPQQTDSLSRLSFGVFIDAKKRQEHSKELNQITLLTKRLIAILYQDQKFYQDAIKANPYIVETLLDRIYQTAIQLPKNTITRAPDLANLNLQDPELNLFLYKILNGTHTKEELAKVQQQLLAPIATLVEERGEDESQDREDSTEEEYKTPTGYRSLLDFITMKDATKIRIYLAPKELLLALYGDKDVVNEIIATRNQLYKAITSGGTSQMKPEDATKDFSLLFQNRALQEYDNSNLDFKVSKTNPKTYE